MGFDKRSAAKEYEPQDDDTLEAIAERETQAGNPITASDIARFNWGTDDPVMVDELLRDQLGAYKKGPDKVWQSEYDIRAEVTVSSKTPSQQHEAIANAGSEDFLGFARPETTWLERRKQEIAAEDGTDLQPASPGDGSDSGPTINEAPDFARSIRWDIGGANLLSGASYFWFFTYVMLGTAVLFVPVGWLYRPKTYLQEEEGDEGSTEKSAA